MGNICPAVKLLSTIGAYLLLPVALAITLASVQPAALAQGYTAVRSVQGTVSDSDGKAVAGAVVKIENTRTLQIRSYITKKNGSYAFHGLSGNIDYQLKAEYQGRTSDTKTLSQFDSRKQAVINLEIPTAS